MSSVPLSPRALLARPASGAGLVGAAAVFVAWSIPTVGLAVDALHPEGAKVWRLVAVGAGPVVGVAVALRRQRAGPSLRLLAAAMTITSGALIAAWVADQHLQIAYGIPWILLAALAANRWPAGTVLTVFVLTSSYGTLTAFTPVDAGPAVDLLLGALWVGLAMRLVTRRRTRPFVLLPGAVLVAVYLLATLTYVPYAPGGVEEGLRAFRTSSWYLLAALLLAYAGWSHLTRRRIAQGIVVVCALVGAYATLRWAIGPAAKEEELAQSSLLSQYGLVGGEPTVIGSFPNGKELGFYAAATIPFCVAAALAMRGRVQLLAMAAVPLLAIGLLGSEYRGGAVAAAAGVLVVLAAHQLSRAFPGPRLGLTGAAIVGIAISAVLIFPGTAGRNEVSAERYSNLLTPSEDPAFQARLFKWENAIEEIEDLPFGRGLGTAGPRQREQRFVAPVTNVDSSYLQVAYEQGFAAMALYIVTLSVLLLGLARRAVWTRFSEPAAIAAGACGTLTALMVAFAGQTYIDLLVVVAAWIIVGLGLAQFTQPELARTGEAARLRRRRDLQPRVTASP